MGNVANECIPRYEPGQRITGKATTAITGCRLLAISDGLSSEGNVQVAPCGAGEQSCGVASHDVASGDLVTFLGEGVVPIDVAADVAAGDLLEAAAVGKVTPAGGADGTAASLTLGSSNSKVRVVANDEGEDGNDITLEIIDPAGNNVALSVDVDGSHIIVTGATDGSSVLTSTAALVIAAINEDNTASQLVTASNGASSDGTGVVAAAATTPLTGGADAAGEGARVIGQAYSDADFSDGDRAFVKLF